MNYYEKIKEELVNNEQYKRIKDYSKNKSDLETYYNVGRLIIEAQGGEKRAKYGDNLIKEYSYKLIEEVDKKYDARTLRRMRQFYTSFKAIKWSPLATKLSWSHITELLPLKDINIINYYIEQCIKRNLSRNKLREIIKNKEYERLPNKTKNKIIKNNDIDIEDFIKNPIILNSNGKEVLNEKTLKNIILENMDNFLTELGDGFCYIKNEYPIKMENRYNYIDILLFNIEYNCYVVVELKVTELKKEHLGQIQVYMNYIDEHLKKTIQNKTIGIIICREDNKFILKYCSDERIFSTKYITI